MLFPEETDYTDIHTHQTGSDPGVFKVRCLLANQEERPHDYPDIAVSVGAHPWYINEETLPDTLEDLAIAATGANVVAIGETGMDKTKGAEMKIQIMAFEKHVTIANNLMKPVIVHCVRAWDELLSVHRNTDPRTPWLIHGFMGNLELAKQLVDRGMFISLWYSFALADRSGPLIRQLPTDRLFLETDSSDSNIKTIYSNVASTLGIPIGSLKERIAKNYNELVSTGCHGCKSSQQ